MHIDFDAIAATPTEGDEHMLARTAPQERADGSGLWWKEFRARHLLGGSPYPAVIEVRYMGPGSAKIEHAGSWRFWWGDDTIKACIYEQLGDSSFERAAQLHPWHAEAVEHLRQVRAFTQAKWELSQRVHHAEGRVVVLMDNANREFREKLAAADESKGAAIQGRMLKKHGGRVQDAKVERDQLRSLLPAAEEALCAVEQARDVWMGVAGVATETAAREGA